MRVKIKTHAAQKGSRFPANCSFKLALPANENGPKPRACDRRVKEGAIEQARGLNHHNSLLRLGTLQLMDRNGIRLSCNENAARTQPPSDGADCYE